MTKSANAAKRERNPDYYNISKKSGNYRVEIYFYGKRRRAGTWKKKEVARTARDIVENYFKDKSPTNEDEAKVHVDEAKQLVKHLPGKCEPRW